MIASMTPEVSEYLRGRLQNAKEHYPDTLSADESAVMLSGSIGYACYFSPDGDIYMETYDLDPKKSNIKIDRSQAAQLESIVLAGNRHPILLSLLPDRPGGARDCPNCQSGWTALGDFRFLCKECHGLGWRAGA